MVRVPAISVGTFTALLMGRSSRHGSGKINPLSQADSQKTLSNLMFYICSRYAPNGHTISRYMQCGTYCCIAVQRRRFNADWFERDGDLGVPGSA